MSVGAALGILTGALGGGASAGPGDVSQDQLTPILLDIEYRFSIIADVLSKADSDATAAVTAATEAATQMEVVGQDVKDITTQTYTVVIPHSLSWLSGYIVSHFIAPIQDDIKTLKGKVNALTSWSATITSWRSNYVDPNLKTLIGFRAWFIGWPQAIMFTWQDWFAHPDHFAQWAAAPLVGPLIAYLADPSHKQTRDNLTDIISQAWREESNDTLEDLYAFLLVDT
jgi:hypothetical protein